jgi:hypothetical protein
MSEVKVNKISPRSGTDVTLGDSGDNFIIPSGVTITNNGTQTGFGRTGTVDWQSTVKTASFTAVNGEGYFVNTTSSAITMTLPAGSAGAIVSIKDYASTFNTNNLIIAANGSEKIGGSTDNANIVEDGIALTLIYIDSTQGWLVTSSGLQTEALQLVTTDFLVIAGGGGGGTGANSPNIKTGAGAGAGGYRSSYNSETSGGGGSSETALELTPGTTYTITVGGGGAGGSGASAPGTPGSDSSISGTGITTITSTGGGYGGQETRAGGPGGSGGGGGSSTLSRGGGSGTANQGFDGGDNGAIGNISGAGGGAGAVGGDGSSGQSGHGGNGVASTITGSSITRAGGGGGGGAESTVGDGGTGGGGDGGSDDSDGQNGTVNTGSGGGGAGVNGGTNPDGGSGGSGVVILRLATADYTGTTTGSPTVTTDGTDTILTYTANGSYTA